MQTFWIDDVFIYNISLCKSKSNTPVVCEKDPHLLGVSKYLCTINISFALISALLNLKGVASLPLFVFHLQQKWRILQTL